MPVLDNGTVRVEIDDDRGRITGLRHAGLGIEVVAEPRLAENFSRSSRCRAWRAIT